MRICPTCGDPAAATLGYCPRCTAPLPEPEYPADPGYLAAPYLAEPGYPAERGYGRPSAVPPEWAYTAEPELYEPEPYGDDLAEPDTYGDVFAGGGPETGAFPARPEPEPEPEAEAGAEPEDTVSRLLYSPPGRARRRPGHRAQITSAALAAVALLAGVFAAWAAFGHHQAGPGSRLAGRQTTAARRASPAPSGRAIPSRSASASPVAPAPRGGATVVTMAPGVSQVPDAAQVDGFLVSYFAAINAHDYEQYARLLIPARRARLTPAEFARGYGTTTDTGASIVGISPTGSGVAATVSFTSQQRAAPGADVTGCTYWDITLYLRKQDGGLLIGNPPAAYHAYHHSCP
jgi:hypothetical protein